VAEHRELPGWPKKRLVKQTRSLLWTDGIRPKGEPWRLTWLWASSIASSYFHTHWPMPNEIASLYMFLLLRRMEEARTLRLPYRAEEKMPDAVRQFIANAPEVSSLDFESRRRKRTSRTQRQTTTILNEKGQDDGR